MKLSEFCSFLDSAIPLSFQEDYDNSGLQVGVPESEIDSALITLDVTEEVVDEAVTTGSKLIVSHHPLIFGGIKKVAERNATERIIRKIIRSDISVYSAHTNLDIVSFGVSRKMAEKLNLKDISVLRTLKNKLVKLVTFIPEDHFEKVRDAIFEAGAGVIGNYDKCGYSISGTGSYRPGVNTNPFSGVRGELHNENEVRFETILFSHLAKKVVRALLAVHPYEEVAYDIYQLENDNLSAGLGCIGELPEPVSETEFLKLISNVFGSSGLRYSRPTGRPVRKVALCGGSGASLISDAVRSDADAFITADIKYHSYFEPDNRLLLVDCGHFETEKYSVEILYDLIVKKFPNFAVRFSETSSNPINYL